MNIPSLLLSVLFLQATFCEENDGAPSGGKTISGSYSYNVDFSNNAFNGNFGNKVGVPQRNSGFSDILKRPKTTFAPFSRLQSQLKSAKSFFPSAFHSNLTEMIPFTKQDVVNISFPNTEAPEIEVPPQLIVQETLKPRLSNAPLQETKPNTITETKFVANVQNVTGGFGKKLQSNLVKLSVPPHLPPQVLVLQGASQPQYHYQPRPYSPQGLGHQVPPVLLQALPVPNHSKPVIYTTSQAPAAPSPAVYPVPQAPTYIMVIPQSNSVPKYIQQSYQPAVVDSNPRPVAAIPKPEIIYQQPQISQPQPVTSYDYLEQAPSRGALPRGNYESGSYVPPTPNIGRSYVVQHSYVPSTQNVVYYRPSQEPSRTPAEAETRYVYAPPPAHALVHHKDASVLKPQPHIPDVQYQYVTTNNEKYTS